MTSEWGPEVPGWTPRDYPEHRSFAGTYVHIEPFDLNHCLALFEAFVQRPENWAYLPYGPFEVLADFQDWAREQATSRDPQFYTFFVDGKAAGMAALMRINQIHGSIEVGHIHFSPLIQGTRAATQGLFLLMDYGLSDLGYRRFEWKCNALNAASCRAATRFGFTFEGIHRQASVFKGRSRDTAWYSILDSEWPALKAAFEVWLQVDNFDSEGQQIRKLSECR